MRGGSVGAEWYTAPMLLELRVENLLLLHRAELRLAAGLNVLTGETGAGKTLLAHALDLLLGGRSRTGIVRAGAAEAYVEGVFSVPAQWSGDVARESAERLMPEDAEEVVLARRVWPDGRTRAYVCGRSATVADLRELGSELLSFYGQHEHRKLMLAAAQLDILDTHCGAAQGESRAALAAAYARVRELEGRMAELEELAGARERELDLLAFELDEIEAAAPAEDEARELAAERERLRHVETLRASAAAGIEALSPESGVGASELLAGAARQLEDAAGIDAGLQGLSERLQGLVFEAQDLGGELRSYLLGIEAPPGRLEEVEERLALFARLERKHGGSIAEVLAHAERCRARREELDGAEVALEQVQGALAAARSQLEALAGELHDRRATAAPTPGRGGARAPGRAGHARRLLRGGAHAASRRPRTPGRGRRAAVDRPQRRRSGRPAARDGLRRRALAGHARAAERGPWTTRRRTGRSVARV